MTERILVIHVGYPKTGTTTLQDGFFEICDEFTFLGKRNRRTDQTRFDWMIRMRDLINDGDDYHVRRDAPSLATRMAADLCGLPSKLSLISYEGFTNPFVDNNYPLIKSIFQKAAHLNVLTSPLRDWGIDVRILITVRPQTSLIPSLFSQVYLQSFAAGLISSSYDTFLDFLFDDNLIGPGPAFLFDEVADVYRTLYGEDKVFVADMRDIFSGEARGSMRAFASTFDLPTETCIEGIGKNKSNKRRLTGPSGVRRLMLTDGTGARRMTKLSGIDIKRAAFGTLARIRMMRGKQVLWEFDDTENRIETYYGESNERFRKLYGIDLRPGFPPD